MRSCGDDPRPIGTQCVAGCPEPHGNQCHCSVCHRMFSTVGNFDRHRRHGWCLDPESVGLRPDARGVYRMPPDPTYRFPGRWDATEAVDRLRGTSGHPLGSWEA